MAAANISSSESPTGAGSTNNFGGIDTRDIKASMASISIPNHL
jgi:hypothetical protein